MIERGRVIEEFLELVQIGSVSRREAGMARRLVPALEALGAEVQVDDAGAAVGGDTGNVLARFRGTAPEERRRALHGAAQAVAARRRGRARPTPR